MANIDIKFKNKTNNAFTGGFFAVLLVVGLSFFDVVSASEITANSVIKLVNEARKEQNIEPLKTNNLLQKAAEKKAQDMIDRNYFAHTSPEGKTPWDFISDSGYNYRFAGENLAINYTDTKQQQEAWMDSPLHRKNILSLDYQEIGVAVKRGVIEGNQTIVTVQEFGSQMPRVLAESITAKPQENNIIKDVVPIQSEKTTPVGLTVDTKNLPVTKFATENSLFDEVLRQISLGEFLQKGRLTVAGWFMLFIFAIVATLVDMIVLIHSRGRSHYAVPESGNRYP